MIQHPAIIALEGAAVATAAMALYAGAFVIVLFWETHRLLAIAAVGLVHLALGAFLLAKARSMGRDAPGPFAASLEELRRDRALLERTLAGPAD